MYFLFAAAALWVWIGKRSAILLAAVFFFGVQIHYYLVLCLVPFAAEEAYNWRPWRRPSARILGGLLGALAGMAILLPQILGTRRIHGSTWWALPSGRDIPAMFTDIFPAGLFLVAMATLWVVLNDRGEPVAARQVSAAERTGWFALTIPIAGYVLAKLITHAFLNRYFIGLLPGAAVGFSCLLWRRFPAMPRISVGVLLLFAGYGVATQTLMARHPDQVAPRGNFASILTQERIRVILAAEEQLRSRGIRYIVIDSRDLLFLEARYYSKHPECYVWWSYSAAAPDVSRYYPTQFWTSSEIKQHAREAVLVDLRPDALEAIQRSEIHTAVHKSGPLFITYLE